MTKWGNSQGIRIPKKYLEELGLKVGERVDIKIEDGKIIIIPLKKKRKPKIDINQLFNQDYKNNSEFEWGKVGKEVW
ncbi:MAG: transcriptional regulator/antitoxin MazE [Hydrogenothermus sp.]|nr:MAG: transcriptional regulator/antitoxin MazE [Hydrogenothermus sp.]